VQRVQTAFSKKSCVLLVGGGLESVAEEIEGNVRVKGGDTGSVAETLIR
jgi:hypothetical protein